MFVVAACRGIETDPKVAVDSITPAALVWLSTLCETFRSWKCPWPLERESCSNETSPSRLAKRVLQCARPGASFHFPESMIWIWNESLWRFVSPQKLSHPSQLLTPNSTFEGFVRGPFTMGSGLFSKFGKTSCQKRGTTLLNNEL